MSFRAQTPAMPAPVAPASASSSSFLRLQHVSPAPGQRFGWPELFGRPHGVLPGSEARRSDDVAAKLGGAAEVWARPAMSQDALSNVAKVQRQHLTKHERSDCHAPGSHLGHLGIVPPKPKPTMRRTRCWCLEGTGRARPRYAQLDFTTIDQRLGTLEELRALTEAAHELGMYVIVDVAWLWRAWKRGGDGERGERERERERERKRERWGSSFFGWK